MPVTDRRRHQEIERLVVVDRHGQVAQALVD